MVKVALRFANRACLERYLCDEVEPALQMYVVKDRRELVRKGAERLEGALGRLLDTETQIEVFV